MRAKERPGRPGVFNLIQSPRLISHYRRTSSMRWPKVAARTCVGKWRGEEGMYLLTVIRAIRAALTHRRYRPELHYNLGRSGSSVTADKPARVKAAGRLGLRRFEAAAGRIDI